MKKNMGSIDRTIRVVAAVLILILILVGEITGALATVLGILAAAFILTSAVGYCPVYSLFKFSTKKDTPAA